LDFIRDSTPITLPLAKENIEGELYGENIRQDEKTPPCHPRFTGLPREMVIGNVRGRGWSKMVLDDLDLKFDYRSSTPKQSPQPLPQRKSRLGVR